MATFFFVTDRESQPLVVAYLDDEWRFWEWAPPTRHFHLADWLVDDYFSATPSLTYDEVVPDVAREWIDKGVGKSQPRFAQRFQRDVKAGRFLATDDLFAGNRVPDETARERADRKAREARARPGWIEYRTYPPSDRANAYAAANQIRSGRVKALSPDEFEAKSHRAQDGRYVVFVRQRADAKGDLTESLTAREREVLGLVAVGMRLREVAETLAITESTARKYILNVVSKLDVIGREGTLEPAAGRGRARGG
ncbi:MAG: hypothetical protein HYU28_07745 [Actinobacteria bacterium]|nr:hypothetical protein [Actinomycetota bacterium]